MYRHAFVIVTCDRNEEKYTKFDRAAETPHLAFVKGKGAG
jgi:hypothetical protein